MPNQSPWTWKDAKAEPLPTTMIFAGVDVTQTQASFLAGVTSNIQTQLNGTIKTTGAQSMAGPLTISSVSNQMVFGTTNTTTLNFTAPAASRVYTIPDAGSAAQFLLSAGNHTVTGFWTFNNVGGVKITSATGQLILGSGLTVATIVASQTANATYTIPDTTTSSFVMTAGNATIGGIKTFSSGVVVSATTNQFVLGVTNTTTITAPAPAASRTYTIPDAGGAASFVMSAGASNITALKTFTAGLAVSGGVAAAGSLTRATTIWTVGAGPVINENGTISGGSAVGQIFVLQSTTGAGSGDRVDIRVGNAGSRTGVSVAGPWGATTIGDSGVSTEVHTFYNVPLTTSTAAGISYWRLNINGTVRRIPTYNDA